MSIQLRPFFMFVANIALMAFIFPPSSASDSILGTKRYIIQPDSVSGKDTFYGTVYHKNGQPDYHELWFGGWGDYYYPFIDFNLDGSPDETKTVDVRLELFSSDLGPNDPKLQLWRITSPWTENLVTSSNYPSADFFSDLPPVKLGWNSYDITRLYLLWKKDPTQQFGVKFVTQNINNTRGSFQSSDYMGDPKQRPRLVITYLD